MKPKKLEFVKIKIVKNILTYYPRPVDNTYYGFIFDRDKEHITIKGLCGDIEGRLVYGLINRFILEDVTIENLSPETLMFIPE